MKRWMIVAALCFFSTMHAVTADYLSYYFPGIVCPPQVKLGLADKYQVAALPNCLGKIEEPDLADGGVAWGSQEAIKKLEINETRIVPAKPILWTRVSMNEAQTGPRSFSTPASDSQPILKQMGFGPMKETWFQWGPYPVRSITAQKKDGFFAMAHVGLNYSGNALCISIGCPPSMTEEQVQEAKALWEQLMRTTQFSPMSKSEQNRFMDRILHSPPG